MDASLDFDKRVRRISRKNKRLARGSRTYIDEMGLVRQIPARQRPKASVRGIVMILLGFALFKAVILASDGPTVYEARLALLEQGTAVEQVGAWVLQIDPVTQGFARALRPVF